ncbi:hypothetical protein B7492_33630 (plasmid) [Bacillus mycoides]|uniref:Uncharacterized protein n=1 Tax=Bacillus mycoides TaxID=1405 RepID=A0A1W6AJE9_BACMY|nr:hypothetical protein [Bacillus mycoides]ARJ25978.1 hypothetical protein B7492_33630 [Bacillus mycoides]
MKIKKILTSATVSAMLVASFSSIASAEENNANNVAPKNDSIQVNNPTISAESLLSGSSTPNDDIGDSGTYTFEGIDYQYEFKEDLEKGIREFSFGEGENRYDIIYDMNKGEVTANGEVVVNNVVTKSYSVKDMPQSVVVIGTDYGGGVYNYTGYDEGSFNTIAASAVVLAGAIGATIFKKNPGAAQLIGVAAGIMAAFQSNYFTLHWNRYTYKSAKKAYYQTSYNFYRDAAHQRHINSVKHYYGFI